MQYKQKMALDPTYLYKGAIRGVIHIGAHMCEERSYYLDTLGLTDQDIVWIEGSPETAAKSRVQNLSSIILHGLCSNKDNDVANFMVASFSQSSSLLSFGTHLQEHPWVQTAGYQQIKTIKLDTLLKPFDMRKFNMINIDVQGAEKMVLEGGTETLKYIDYINSEVNEAELYKGCCLLPDFDAFLQSHGFTRVSTEMSEHKWGDALYVRDHLVKK